MQELGLEMSSPDGCTNGEYGRAWHANCWCTPWSARVSDICDVCHRAKRKDHCYRTLKSIHSRVLRWADLSIVQSILAQQDIREGVDFMHRQIDTCIATCHVVFSYNWCAVVPTDIYRHLLPGENQSNNCAWPESTCPGRGARPPGTPRDSANITSCTFSVYPRKRSQPYTLPNSQRHCSFTKRRTGRLVVMVWNRQLISHRKSMPWIILPLPITIYLAMWWEDFADHWRPVSVRTGPWFSTNKLSVELRDPGDADNPTIVNFKHNSSDSRGPAEAHSRPGSSRWRINSPLSFSRFRSSGPAASEPSGCPKIPPLALGVELNLSFPSQVFLEEPSSSQASHSASLSEAPPTTPGLNHIPGGSSNDAVSPRMHQPITPPSTSSFSNTSGISISPAVLPGELPSPHSSGRFSVPSKPSPVQSRYSSIPTAPHDTRYSQIITHQPCRVSVSSISSSSGASSSALEVSLNIRNSIRLWSDDARFIRKATMRGLVQYLLLNPEGEPWSSH